MVTRFLALPAFLLPLVACTPDDEDKDGSGTIGESTDTGTPHLSAPEITSITFAQGEPDEQEDGTLYPTIQFTVDFEDDDGDAHVIRATAWADETVDGSVDSTGSPVGEWPSMALLSSATGEPAEDGEGFGGTLLLGLGITGGDLNFETLYEFGVIVYDSVDTPSNVGLTSGTTPAML